MAGSREGGLKAAALNKEKDPDHYSKIGRLGGKTPRSTPRGFAAMTFEERSEAGRKGGSSSRKTGKNKKTYTRRVVTDITSRTVQAETVVL